MKHKRHVKSPSETEKFSIVIKGDLGISRFPVIGLGRDAELLDVTLGDRECFGSRGIVDELGLGKLIKVFQRLWVLENSLHHADRDFGLLYKVVLGMLNF